MLFGNSFWFLMIFFAIALLFNDTQQIFANCNAYMECLCASQKPSVSCLQSGKTCNETQSFSLSAFNVCSLSTMTPRVLYLLIVPVMGKGRMW